MVEQTSLGHIKFWPFWAVDEKLISILDVVGYKLVFLGQAEGQDVSYSVGVIPIKDPNIRGGRQVFWCVSLLRYNGHVYISHREHH